MSDFNLNDYLAAFRGHDGRAHATVGSEYRSAFPVTRRITCKDGFSLSVQANSAAYCAPRDNHGPWWEVEVGFPSAAPERIAHLAENPDDLTGTVYGYVDIELVEQLIELHGGPDAETLERQAQAQAIREQS